MLGLDQGLRFRLGAILRNFTEWLLAQVAFTFFLLFRALGPKYAGQIGALLMRTVGRFLPENAVALCNLRHAFPDILEDDRRRILVESWESLGRTYAEYPNLDRLWRFDPAEPTAGRIEVAGADQFARLQRRAGPAIIFTAHLANWEILPIAAYKHGLTVSALYRPPNNRYVARKILQLRARSMGRLIPSGRLAALSMAAALERGDILGLLVDQHFSRGLPVPFFGRQAKTNTSLARLAARYECPIHGARVIRLPNGGYRVELTPEIEPVRDAVGQIEVHATMARVTAVVESWVREYPGQWLWQHRRWRV